MTEINRVFVVNFDKYFPFVIYFLIKSHCYLLCVNLFHIPGFPTQATPDVKPIFSSSIFENFLMWKLLFVLLTGTHLVLIVEINMCI